MKKLMLAFAPLFAVAALVALPAMASAATTYGTCGTGTASSNCPGSEHFTAFPANETVKVKTKKPSGAGNVFLTVKKTGATITCTSLTDKGTIKNVAGVGESAEELTFDGCTTPVSATLTCSVQTTGSGTGNIVGTVSDKIKSQTEVTIKRENGFAIVFSGTPAGCPAAGAVVGTVTGSAVGKETEKTNVLKFAATTGLKLEAEETEFTGEDELETEAGVKVYI